MIPLEIIQEQMDNYDKDSWELKKKQTKNYIKRFKAKSLIKIKSLENWYILHCLLGDIHLGAEGIDMQKAEDDAILIGGCEYARGYHLGDSIDNFIKTKIIGALINQTTTPKEQIKLMQQYFEFFAGNLILMIGGNHDRWTKEVSGLDWLSPFTKTNSVAYSPDEFNINFQYQKVEYRFKFRHLYRFNSNFNITHPLKQAVRFSDDIYDVYAKGHTHQASIEQCEILGLDRLFIVCSTYKICDPFSRERGFNQGNSIMPCFITSPFERKMIPFYRLEDGIKVVNLLNQELKDGKR